MGVLKGLSRPWPSRYFSADSAGGILLAEDHKGHRVGLFIGQCQMVGLRAQSCQALGRSAAEVELRRAPLTVLHFYMLPRNTLPNPRAQRFTQCLFGGKPFRQKVVGQCRTLKFQQLCGRQNTLGKGVAQALEAGLDTRDFHNVGTYATDHTLTFKCINAVR